MPFPLHSLPSRLSRVIAQRWKDLPEYGKAFYRQLAKADWNKYQQILKQNQSAERTSLASPKSLTEQEASRGVTSSIDPPLDGECNDDDLPASVQFSDHDDEGDDGTVSDTAIFDSVYF